MTEDKINQARQELEKARRQADIEFQKSQQQQYDKHAKTLLVLEKKRVDAKLLAWKDYEKVVQQAGKDK